MAHGKKNGSTHSTDSTSSLRASSGQTSSPQDGEMSLNKLAFMMGRGFNATDKRFDLIDKRFVGMDKRFDSVEALLAILEVDAQEVKKRLDKIEESIASLAGTLDAFLKRLTAREEEFAILKREMSAVKRILKEKLNTDVDALK